MVCILLKIKALCDHLATHGHCLERSAGYGASVRFETLVANPNGNGSGIIPSFICHALR